jgi:hypothetical protein
MVIDALSSRPYMFFSKRFKNLKQKPASNRPERQGKILSRWLFAGLGLLIILLFVLSRVWRAMPRLAMAEISEITGCEVNAGSIDFKLNGSVLIENLVIKPYTSQGSQQNGMLKYDDALLKAKTVYARFSMGSLLFLVPRLKEIHISNFVFNSQYDLDINRWNLSAFKFSIPKRGIDKMPLIVLDSGKLQYSKVSKGQTVVLAEVPVDAGIRPDKEIKDGCSFEITTAKRAGSSASAHSVSRKQDRSRLVGFWQSGRVTVSGSFSTIGVPELANALVIDALDASLNYDRNNNFLLKMKIGNLSYPRESVEAVLGIGESLFSTKSVLFTSLQSFFNRYNPEGQVDIGLEVSGNFDRLNKSTIAGHVLCKDITLCDIKFPYTLAQVTGRIDFTENSAILNSISGNHNDVKVTITGWVKDFGPGQRYQIQITSDNMALDDDLYESLNTKQKEFWTVFYPSGTAAVDYSLSQESPTDKRKSLMVELRGAEAAYQRFPYPLKALNGKLYFDQNDITVTDLVSRTDTGMITFNGKVLQYDTDNTIYNLSIKASDMPFDPTLIKTFLSEQKALYDQCNMAGLVDADIKIFTPAQDTVPTSSGTGQVSPYVLSLSKSGRASFFADITLKQASLKANKTALLISDISAKIHLTPDSTSIKNFTGRLGESVISLVGGVWLTGKTQLPRYYLAASAKQARLSDELIGLLPSPFAKIVSDLQPSGKVSISANVRSAGNDEKPDYSISV